MAIKEYCSHPFSEHDAPLGDGKNCSDSLSTQLQRDDLSSMQDEEDGGKAANLLAVYENNHEQNVNPSEADEGGALWDVFRWKDVPNIEEYVKKHRNEFRHLHCSPVQQVAEDGALRDIFR